MPHPRADDMRQRPPLHFVALLHDARGVHLRIVLAAVAEHWNIEEVPGVGSGVSLAPESDLVIRKVLDVHIAVDRALGRR